MNAEKQRLLQETHEIFMEVCLYDRPLDQLDRVTDPDIMGYGSARDEKITSLHQLRDLLESQREQAAGLDMRIERMPVYQHISMMDDAAVIVEEASITISANGQENRLSLHISGFYEFRGDKWMAVHLHGSAPQQSASKVDTWHINEWRRKNAELQAMVDERTADLVKKNKELEIEAALERVRSIAMAMQKPDDLLDICEAMFIEFRKLGFDVMRNAMINIHDDEKKSFINYDFSDTIGRSKTPLVYDIHPVIARQISEIRSSKDAFSETVFAGEDLESWKKFRKERGEQDDSRIDQCQALYYYFYSIGDGSIGMSTFSPITEEKLQLLKRFRNVFNLAYQRYASIMQAETQAREAQIQLALERVRAKTMAMQKSDELAECSYELVKQVQSLGIAVWHCAFNIYDTNQDSSTEWGSNGKSRGTFAMYKTPRVGIFLKYYQAGQAGASIHVEVIGEDRCIEHYAWLCTLPGVGEQLLGLRNAGIPFPTMQIDHVAYFKYGYLLFITYEPVPEAHEIFIRFAKVFEQTYARFLDLQNAEAQAKETEIELGLERVRAKAMSMGQSTELAELVAVVFKELIGLGFPLTSSIIWIHDHINALNTLWIASAEMNKPPQSYNISPFHNDFFKSIIHAWKARDPKWTFTLASVEKAEFEKAFFEEIPELPREFKKALMHPEEVVFSASFNNFGALEIVATEPLSDDKFQILHRFGKVFDLSYTRFHDLKKAEAQAGDAQIEAALERVRAKVMAMNNSKDLDETSLVFGEQLRKLGIDWQFSYFWLVEETKDENTFWITWPDFKTSITVYTLAEAAQYFNECLVEWRKGTRIHDNFVPKPEVQAWLDTFQRIADDAGGMAKEVMQAKNFPDGVFYYDAMMKYGSFGICINKPATDEQKNIQCRFAVEFERAYTRFLDLKTAETQAHRARIETALERVRARALAMQEPEELVDVARVLRQEMGQLGVEALETGTVFIRDTASETAECWFAIRDQKHADRKLIADHIKLDLNATWVGKRMFDFFERGDVQVSIPMRGQHRKEWIEYCYGLSSILDGYYGAHIPDRIYHLYKFSNGAIGAAAPGEISAESWELLQRTASVFSLAYSRFRDLSQARTDLQRLKEEKTRAEIALTELRAAQSQLVQSEKMASLGELTAGIAHEIQNPLNFVNNFSDLNRELLDELKEEIEKGDMKEAGLIVENIRDNESKVNLHGKRADGIVKSMLQHSRSSSGQKELTDINALADEYLRLAYHGLRAKDKTFNSAVDTDLDPFIGKVNIIPQDIGRVLLNLYNNAFYAVNERKKTTAEGYEPRVTVSTKKSGDSIEVRVTDNGMGIPESVHEKIFQPFFTTKPTGQGTGLGLSLSYDIVKAHGGTIEVYSVPGEGTEFRILLPV